MKNTPIALAAAVAATLAAGSALAQSSVTVYGRVNVTAENQKNINVDGTQQVLQNNASRLGFTGVEDLGGGLKAEFLLEHRFNVDTGSITNPSVYWAGDAFLGLSGGWGKLRAGRITSAAYYATADFVSLHNHDTGTSEDKLYTYLGQNANTVAYLTPSFGGLTVEGSVSAAEGPDKSKKVWGLAANYDAGALQLGAGYEIEEANDDYQLAVRALYSMGAFTFGGYYQYSDLAALGDRNNFRGAVMYTFGASELHFNVGYADDWGLVDNSAATQYTIAYNYNLSKRTKVYAFYTTVDQDSFSYFGALGANGEVLSPSSFAVGIRHNF
ncbi:MAG: porin [Rubrivivax sp.]|nr:porin [Rubrivivax sp.]